MSRVHRPLRLAELSKPSRQVFALIALLLAFGAGKTAAGADNRHRPPTAPAITPAVPAVTDAQPTLDAARRALREGLPIVAIHRLTLLLQGNPPAAPDARRESVLLLARAHLGAGAPRGALDVLTASPDESGVALFLRAQAHAALGEWTAALETYERAAATTDPTFTERSAARFGRAETLHGLGRNAEAARAFEELLGAPAFAAAAGLRLTELALQAGQTDAAERYLNGVPAIPGAPLRALEKRLLAARLQLARGQAAQAEATLTAVLRGAPRGWTENLLAAAYAAWAETRFAQGRVNDALAALTEFAERYPRHPELGKILDRIESFLTEEPAPDLSVLVRWSQDDAQPAREAFATLALAHVRRRMGQVEAAETLLEDFSTRFPGDPLRSQALLALADLQLARSRPAAARVTLGQARTALMPGGELGQRQAADELDARVALVGGDFDGAAALYERIARAPETLPARAAAADSRAALARLRAGDEEGFVAARRELERRFPDRAAAVREVLGLEEALIRAAQVDERPWTAGAAAAALQKFLTEQPGSPAAGTARVALAELAFGRGDFDGARGELRAVVNAEGPGGSPPSTSSDRAEALAVWVADAPGAARDAAGAVARAREFLARWPASPLVAGVRLKLGEILFRQEDYPAAQTELEAVAAETGASPAQVENARYLAGLAALRGLSSAGADRAVGLFEDTAKVGGPLRLAARLRQAETLRDRLGKPADALLVYDSILGAAAPPADATTRCAALCGKGETLLANPARAADAAGWFEQAATVRDAPVGWRRQALTRQGEALEKAGNTAAALAAYDDALNAADPAAAAVPEGEFVWFYRAGFAAARLLRASGQWKAAIAVYGKVAAPDGPLRAEAEAQAQALRLEHFVWDESS